VSRAAPSPAPPITKLLDAAEIAVLLNVSPDTVKRDWKLAKAWLGRELRKQWRVTRDE
jgi:DNA-directed RNA polymerase specialized sigma24 family protein